MEPGNEVKEYIRGHLEQGFSSDEIIHQLKSAGWHDDHILPAMQWAKAAYERPAPGLHEISPAIPVSSTHANGSKFGARKSSKRAFVAVFAVIVLLVISAGGVFAYTALSKESAKQTFEKTVLKSMQTGTYHQKFTDKSSKEGEIVVNVQSDFRNPKSPKVSGEMSMIMDLDAQASIKGTLTIKQEIVAIDDKVYVKTTEFKAENISNEIKDQLLSLATGDPNVTVESVLMASFGVTELDAWTEYDISNFEAFSITQGESILSGIMAKLGATINTVTGQFIVGDLGSQAPQLSKDLLSSGAFTIDYNRITTQSEGGVNYLIYPLNLNKDASKNFNLSLIEKLGLSEREKGINNEDDQVSLEDTIIWINPKTHLPHKLVFDKENTQSIEYSDFGANYNIKAPL